MNREEFIAYAETLDDASLQKIANEIREKSTSRIPEEVAKQFRNLDDKSHVEELFVETDFGKTHLYFISSNRQEQNPVPVIINIHGGGWALPHTERDIYFCRRIALNTNCLVADIDYVLAPEYPYPAALEEIEALSNVLANLIQQRNGDLDRIILCGQSAGGNLAAALTQRKKLYDKLSVIGQILCYFPADNYRNRFGTDTLTPRDETTEYYGFFYNEIFDERKNSDVSLVYAGSDDLIDLPETIVITAGQDNLMPEAREYYELLKEAGIKVEYRCFENSKHGFLVNLYDEWQEGEDYVVHQIQKMLK